MKFKTLARQFAAASFVWGAFAASSQATVLTTTDLTPIDGTSWSTVMASPVRVDFGAGYGAGTITVTSINGGALTVIAPNDVYAPALPGIALDANTTLNLTTHMIFTLEGSATGSGLLGINVAMALDNGSFAAGSVLNIFSLDWRTNGLRQFFSPGDSFLANPYAASLPSDLNGRLIIADTDADGDLWSTSDQAAQRVSEGRAFALDGATNAFDFRVLATFGTGNGIALSFALPAAAAVAEPESLALMLAALAICGGISARRKTARLSA